MTLSEWMGQNGYSAYNSALGRKQLRNKYGITESDGYKANMQLWHRLKQE